jgi:hypothetical protein
MVGNRWATWPYMTTMVDRGHYKPINIGLNAREHDESSYKSYCQQINYGHLKADIGVMNDEDYSWYHRYHMQY